MIYTKDKTLSECHPKDDISLAEFMQDCEKVVNTPGLHSDEWSSDDEDLAKEERDGKKRPERSLNTNSVIKVLNKKWRSTRVCNKLRNDFLKI